MSEPRRRRTVCVLGFGRSGTSLTMQALKTLGVELGAEDDLLQPQEGDNPRGYWEPQWMVDLNDEILAALGTTWWQPFPGESGWESSPLLAPLRERAHSLFAEKLGGAPLSGWKDPRTTLTLPLWRAVVPHELLYVICLRNPVDAIASIQRRPEPTLPTQEWGELWLEYTARALRETTGRPRMLIFYEDYFRDLDAQVAQLASLLDVPPDDERVGQAKALVESDLRHHQSSSGELAATSGLTATVRSAYLALRTGEELRRDANPERFQICDAIEHVIPDVWEHSRELTDLRRRARQLEVEQARATTLAGRIAQAELQLAREREQLTTLRQSRSWRMTAPLRALRGHLRRRPRRLAG